MKSRVSDPRHLDVEPFAAQGGTLEGTWPLVDLKRLHEAAAPDAPPAANGDVRWNVQGEARTPRTGAAQSWLHVTADTEVALVCQRCLRPVSESLHAERSFCFVVGEDAAAELDADIEDDVLALTRSLDLRTLVEDELLLTLPLVPRHDVCPDPLVVESDPVVPEEETPNPFAALAALRRRPVN